MSFSLSTLSLPWKRESLLLFRIEKQGILIELFRQTKGRTSRVSSTLFEIAPETILKQPTESGELLAQFLLQSKISARPCAAIIPLSWVLTTSIPLPEAGEENLADYFELQAERKFSIALSEIKLAHAPYSLPEGKKEAILAALPIKKMEPLQQMLLAARCPLFSLSLGIEESLLQAQSQKAGLLFLSGDETSLDFVAAHPSGIIQIRTISAPNPWDLISFTQELRTTLGKLPSQFRKEIHHFRWESKLPLYVQNQEGFQAQIRSLNLRPQSIPSESKSLSLLATASTLLLGKIPLFEFIPYQITPLQSFFKWFKGKGRKRIVAAVLLSIIIPLIAFGVQTKIESDLQKQWTQMEPEVTALEALQTTSRQFRPWFTATPNDLLMLNSLISVFPETGEIWVKSLEIKENSKIVCIAFAKQQSIMNEFLERLRKKKEITGLQVQQVRGNNPIQFSFSFLWKESHEN